MPCFFVAKMEIERLAVFRQGGAERAERFLSTGRAWPARCPWPSRSTERLKLPVPVLLFPEGTSTDGAQVLRFHSRLIDPATAAGAPITAAAIRYVIDGGVEERELCWYGDETFMPHLWKVLGVDRIFGAAQIWRAADLFRPSRGRRPDPRGDRGMARGDAWQRCSRRMSTDPGSRRKPAESTIRPR